MKQALNFFDLGLAFAISLIKDVKIDKSWAIEKYSKNKFKKLLKPFFCHIKAEQIRKTYFNRVLKITRKH